MHLFCYFRLLAFFCLPLKAKLGIFIKEQGPQALKAFGRGPRLIKV